MHTVLLCFHVSVFYPQRQAAFKGELNVGVHLMTRTFKIIRIGNIQSVTYTVTRHYFLSFRDFIERKKYSIKKLNYRLNH